MALERSSLVKKFDTSSKATIKIKATREPGTQDIRFPQPFHN
jgi:hypothetical protein